ncbi:unnamed protein product [Linum tenue]|uniref:Uncharacterized protein n=1 Tax=Linum tenue TaxID=586396 RepID=A0AAV0RTF4_9ROSI|nr:unnamed protein product [Linum tenue]
MAEGRKQKMGMNLIMTVMWLWGLLIIVSHSTAVDGREPHAGPSDSQIAPPSTTATTFNASSSGAVDHPTKEYWCRLCCCIVTIGRGDCCTDHD